MLLLMFFFVVIVYINHEKKFVFVEKRSVEEASNAMYLDYIRGRNLMLTLLPNIYLSFSVGFL